MATITRGTARTMIQQMLDDPSAKRWTAANLDQLTELILDNLWSDILDTAPYYNSQYDQLTTTTAPGYVDLRLVADGGALSQRYYRFQQVIANSRQYYAKDPRDYLLLATGATLSTVSASSGVEQAYTFQFLGDQLWLHPLGSNGDRIELRYNFRPTRYTALANDNTVVPFPDGCELAYILKVAGLAMLKGNAEDSTALLRAAEDAKETMLNSIRRRYMGPTVVFAGNSPVEFGGT